MVGGDGESGLLYPGDLVRLTRTQQIVSSICNGCRTLIGGPHDQCLSLTHETAALERDVLYKCEILPHDDVSNTKIQ